MKNMEVRVNDNMKIKFYEIKGTPIMEVQKGIASLYCSGMDFTPDIIEIEDPEFKVPFQQIRYDDDPKAFNALEDQYFTEEDNEAITATIWKDFFGVPMYSREETATEEIKK